MYTLQFDGPFRIITNLGSRVILPASYTEWLKNCPDLDHQALVQDVCCSCLCQAEMGTDGMISYSNISRHTPGWMVKESSLIPGRFLSMSPKQN
jgi:hypothetical protein